MPLKIEIVLPQAELAAALDAIDPLVVDGIVAVRDLHVRLHRTRRRLIPAGLLARDIMTTNPRTVAPDTRVADVVRLLVGSSFHGVPVVDADRRVVGIITQSDLIRRAGLPLRLGLLAHLDEKALGAQIERLSQLSAQEVMTRPVVTVREDEGAAQVVRLMLEKRLKRLPVVDREGRLCGMASRVDVFRIVRDAGDVYETLEKHRVDLTQVRFVRDMVQRDMQTVLPDTPVEEILKHIGGGEGQRVAVVDRSGRFMGLLFDHDLLKLLLNQAPGLWDRVVRLFSGEAGKDILDGLQSLTAEALMQRDIVTISENAPIDEAVRVMTERAFKRLPVVDDQGLFKGMISRDAVLRAGWEE